MANPIQRSLPLGDTSQLPNIIGTTLLLILAYVGYSFLSSTRAYPNIPLIIGKGGIEESRQKFREQSVKFLDTALKQVNDVCQVWTDGGLKILIPTKYINEIRNDKRLDFLEVVRNENLAHYRSFSPSYLPMKHNHVTDAIRTKLTQSLGKITEGLSEETDFALKNLFPPSKEWVVTKPFYPIAVDFVSQLSARVFLGDKLCRDPEWIRVSGDYTGAIFMSIQSLRKYPKFLQPIMYYLGLIPEIKALDKLEEKATEIIEKEVARQNALGPDNVDSNSLKWFADVAKQKKISEYNPVFAQLALTIAAIHTTSMSLTNVLFDLIAHPDLIAELRQEIIAVIGTDGWKKTSLGNLRLMDSALKESQRLNPPDAFSMRRRATEDIRLSSGVVIKKGAMVVVPPRILRDAELYPDPDAYDGRRWYRLRQEPGNEMKFQFVQTSAEMHGFGHGEHACPGRFFASNELKIALCHMLMKYDWEYADARERPETITKAELIMPDPTVRLRYKSREPEIAL
ncbi:Cytochrome P450 [Lasiodiplodia theobromae]|uniref:Cytochrome P450 n=1 Tax=Lasiodiplodia theobromae TaxID=45133 RepID=UPI0015C38C30|nr:Cytochrome P450 [Lasiodiplodia theobromae]KAF4546155.1 Cytochrome P450 [Lasiodiplodia theobromae]